MVAKQILLTITDWVDLNCTGKWQNLGRICLNLELILCSLLFKWTTWFVWLMKKTSEKVKTACASANIWQNLETVTIQKELFLLVVGIVITIYHLFCSSETATSDESDLNDFLVPPWKHAFKWSSNICERHYECFSLLILLILISFPKVIPEPLFHVRSPTAYW